MENSIRRKIERPKALKPAFILLAGMVLCFLPSCEYAPTEPLSVQSPLQIEKSAIEDTSELPQRQNGDVDPFASITRIWAENSTPSYNNEIVLCRKNFSNQGAVQQVDLELFADTRYEVWVDGVWIGRGPPRFSKTLREYDIYSLDELTPGDHLIAILSQWAPSIRRSESSTPYIKARILGRASNGEKILTTTSQEWRCLRSDAWRPDAVPVHEWGLIGPTELLDLRQLPVNWNLPTYQDTDWPDAVVVETLHDNDIRYQPRSIPGLDNTPIPASLLEVGAISPGMVIGEITPDTAVPHNITITATKPTSVTFEILVTDQHNPVETGFVEIDGFKPEWRPAHPSRPDVYQTSVPIDAGEHQIVFSDEATFSISKKDLNIQEIPFSQGSHAGRRSLLAQLISNKDQVHIAQTNGQLDIEFVSPPAFAILDLGRTVHGRLTAEVDGPSGSILDIGWDERLTSDTHRPLPFPGSLHPQWNQVDSWIIDGATRTLTTIDARAGRYILIAAWGEDPIHLKDIRVHEEHYPVSQVGSFHSSDPLLDQVWKVGVDLLLPTMLDAYVDTPWRERGQWWGDAYVANRINQVAFGDDLLIQRAIKFMGNAMVTEPAPGLAPSNHGHHMLDYAMLWVHSLAETIQNMPHQPGYSLAADNYVTLTKFMAHLEDFENPDTGLLELPEGHWSQNAYIDSYAWHSRVGQPTALNALYYGTLGQAAHIAELVNDPKSATEWRAKAELVKDNVNEVLFLPSKHQYLSSNHAGETTDPSPHAQAWPLAYDLVPVEEIPFVADALMELLSTDPGSPNINVYGMYWALEALGKSGEIQRGVEVIRQYYGYLLAQGATTWWEVFSIYPNPDQSHSHGWGGAPTTFLSKYVLGARQTGPDQWQIQPDFASVSYASGTVPIQNSLLHVEWEKRSCSKMTVNILSSNNTGGYFVLSHEPSLTIRLDGALIWHQDKSLSEIVTLEAPHIRIALNGGHHKISIDRICTNP